MSGVLLNNGMPGNNGQTTLCRPENNLRLLSCNSFEKKRNDVSGVYYVTEVFGYGRELITHVL